MDLPEFGNREQVAAAVRKQEAVITRKKAGFDAEIDAERAYLKAIRKMCEHEYSTRYAMGRDAGRKCDHCEGWE